SLTGEPIFSGTIFLESGELQRDLDLSTLLRSIPSYLFSGRESRASGSEELPHIGLDLTFKATRNLFVITDWLGAELRGELRFTGTLAQPSVQGSLETLTGWFGLKDRRFEITSGMLHFQPGYAQPSLEVMSEGTIRSRTGESIFVLLEATGPLSAPRVTLSSDRGLSQKEILQLLTSSGGLTGSQTIASTTGATFDVDEPLFRDVRDFD